ncbi:MAG: GNAT family N-acetyltransferase [Pseudomonadota bacterium]|nr:GNAT family N-acetyltransferase [Pseudomonadota bacterium]
MASSASLVLPDETRHSAAPVATPTAQTSISAWRGIDRADFRAAWDALARRAAEPNPFFESWYLLPALRAHDPAGEVQVFCFYQDAELAGLIPLARLPRYYGKPIPHWSAWMHGNCFLGAPLVAKGHEAAFWRALLAWTDSHAGAGLFLHLPHLPLDGPNHRALTALCAQQRRPAGLVHREERAMLASDLGPEAYLEAALTGKKRKELRRQFARLSELGALTIVHSRDNAGLEQWIEDFLALEHSGWKGSAGSALASHHTTAQLFREALPEAAALGRLERLTLALDGEPLAMLVTFLTAPGAFSYKTAFDERFARFSPGVLLQRANLAMLDDPAIAWTDSCAAADHPMIDHVWRERRAIGRISLGIGGAIRRLTFSALLRLELGRHPAGLGQ